MVVEILQLFNCVKQTYDDRTWDELVSGFWREYRMDDNVIVVDAVEGTLY
jgi:hypothetical protein